MHFVLALKLKITLGTPLNTACVIVVLVFVDTGIKKLNAKRANSKEHYPAL